MAGSRSSRKVLLQFLQRAPSSPGLLFVVGFLVGASERLLFVREWSGERPGVQLVSQQRLLVPAPAVRAIVRNVPLYDPASIVGALSDEHDVIEVILDDMYLEQDEDYQELLSEGEAYRQGHDSELSQLEQMKAQLDQALDIYNECRKLLQVRSDEGATELDSEEAKKLEHFLTMARKEMSEISRKISSIEQEQA